MRPEIPSTPESTRCRGTAGPTAPARCVGRISSRAKALQRDPAGRLRRVGGSSRTRGKFIESGEPAKNDNRPASTRPENRKPIWASGRGGSPRQRPNLRCWLETQSQSYRHARPCAGHPRPCCNIRKDVDGGGKHGHEDIITKNHPTQPEGGRG